MALKVTQLKFEGKYFIATSPSPFDTSPLKGSP